MDYENLIDEQLKAMDLRALEELMGQQDSLFEISIREIINRVIHGQPLCHSDQIFSTIINFFLKEVSSSISLGIKIVAVCIVMGLMLNLSSALGKSAVSTIGAMVCSCVVIALCLINFMDIYRLCELTIERMALLMQVLLPILLPLIITMGGFATGGIMSPVLLGAITLFTTFIQKIVLPAIFYSCVFILGNSLADRDYIRKLAVLLRGFASFAMGLAVTIFSGMSVIQGIVTKSADSILIKTAKYSMDNFVPIVGGFAADSMEMVISCTGVIKNSVGVFGLLVLITLVTIPILKLLSIALIYKITAALVEPIGNKVISDCLSEIGNTVITLGIIVFLGALLFIIFLSILISIGTAM